MRLNGQGGALHNLPSGCSPSTAVYGKQVVAGRVVVGRVQAGAAVLQCSGAAVAALGSTPLGLAVLRTCNRPFTHRFAALFTACRDGSRIPDDALVAAEETYQELIDQLHER